MNFQVQLLRAGPCPNCGGPVEFASGSAPTQVCKFCRYVIVRTDRDMRSAGKVADLIPMATPFGTEARGSIEGRPFRVAGRVQYDRVQAPGAPWEEIYIELDQGGWSWLSHAQGRWLVTSLYPHQLPVRPPSYAEANPGVLFPVPNMPELRVVERGQRRFVSAEGELPFPMVPNQVEPYADLSGAGGAFATIDYDAQGMPAYLYFGREIDPRQLTLSSGAPVTEAPRAQVTSLTCPKCGGNFPLRAPDATERLACQFCGMLCDVNQGALVALKPLPLPPIPPAIALGAKGNLRGQDVMVLGYVMRSTVVDGERYGWREYLLYVAATSSFVFLLEEDGAWQHIVPIQAGELQQTGPQAFAFRGQAYQYAQGVQAVVDYVLGEFYWRVEQGETVMAYEFHGPGGVKLNQESTKDEVQFSVSTPLGIDELRKAFPSEFTGPKAPAGVRQAKSSNLFFLVLFGLWFAVSMVGCVLSSGKPVLDQRVPVVQMVKKPLATPELAKSEAFFSEPFRIDGGRNLKLKLAPGFTCLDADDSWITADIALVHMDSGQVWEDSVEFADEPKAIWYSRVPEGQYVLRVEPDSKVPATCQPMQVTLVSGALPWGYVMGSLGVLVVLWIISARKTTA
ncbi:DUF4178 domain-containing protein [Pendulispora rubella]|uniref:DUF4178 domain-containing protein n=1 Tax=Pendulispora rubella TaxID=2741070 RepID=A0ABZ2LFZ1_9BACT